MEHNFNHKGGLCQHKFLICQEGCCSNCMIHLDSIMIQQLKPLKTPVASKRIPAFAVSG
jgi:hypothetical protein